MARLDHCGMCHLPPIVLIDHHRLSSGFDTVISPNMTRLNTFLDYLMGRSSRVVQYLNRLEPATATPPPLLVGFRIIMFPLTARFSFSALALRRCFGATYRSFRSTIPSRPLKRPSLSNATSMQTRFSSNKPMHILRRMMGLSAVAVVLKDAESSVATDATTCADVSQTNTVAEVEETMTSKTEVVSEVKPTVSL